MMRRFKAAAEKAVAQKLKTAKGHEKRVLREMLEGGPGKGILWSFDNPSIHEPSELEAIGITGKDCFELAAASGDMHHAIEHIHGIVQQAFTTWQAHHTNVTSPSTMQQELMEVFRAIKPSSVKKDVRDLVHLWRAIKEAGGNYVDYKFRCARKAAGACVC